ncbi:MAG: glycosyltransferase [Candidatus Nitrosocaldus sp.]
MQKVSIILPTYNERENIVELINEIRRNLGHSVEIIVVDDDSPDGTWQEVEKITNENIRLLKRTDQRCLTTAIADGIAMARGEVIGWMDCDFSMPPERLPALVESLKDHDIAIGSRYVGDAEDKRDTSLGIISSKIINYTAKYILDSSITDYTSGFVVAKREVLMEIPLRGDYGEYCIDFLYRAIKRGFRVKEIPYRCIPRRSGETKTAPNLTTFIRRGVKYISTILRLRFQDL